MDPIAAMLFSTLGLGIWSELRGRILVGFNRIIPQFLELDRHLCILGPTRSGKTRLAKRIASRTKARLLVFDWNGEYDIGRARRISAKDLSVDLSLIPKKLIAEIIGLALNMNEPSIYFLYRSIRDTRVSSIDEMIEAVENFMVVSRAEAEMKAAILRRLEYIRDAVSSGGGLNAVDLLRGDFVVDLSVAKLMEERTLTTLLVLSSLYPILTSLSRTNDVRLLVVVDEAQNVIERSSVIPHYLMETAKYGVRMVLVTNVVPRAELLAHCNLVITGRMGGEWRNAPLLVKNGREHRLTRIAS